MIDIEIDGKPLQAREGSMVIEAADAAGIHIPRFCYHKKLTVAANCRMCLIEVEKVPKPLPACATPVTANMKVFTRSKMALEAQKAVMEFLLINHPLDCPICDQGGQCELQDVAMGYGKGISRYNQGKRSVDDEDLGSLVATDMTRCIHCTRCVRFGTEIAGIRELGTVGRGERVRIATYIKHSMTSELSGNIIDVCPVGALTSKPFRFTARAWELHQHETIAAHDCVGSNVYVHTRAGQVMRVVPKENEAINEVWLSDRDRFSYQGLYSEERLETPMIKRNGVWEKCDWPTALKFTVDGLQKIIAQYDAEQIGALISPNATLEEQALFQKVMRGLGCYNIDHRIRDEDFSYQEQAPLFPSIGTKIADLSSQDVILLVGSNVRYEQPIINHRIRQSTLHGAKVMAINFIDYEFNFDIHAKTIIHPAQMLNNLIALLKAVAQTRNVKLPAALDKLTKNITVSTSIQQIADGLAQGKKITILQGALVQQHPEAGKINHVITELTQLLDAKSGSLTMGANSAGAWITGCIPHRGVAGHVLAKPGFTAAQMFANKLPAYVLYNVDPALDCANPALVIKALTEAKFVVSISPYRGGVLDAHADVILPIVPYSETSGTFINCEGQWQHFNACTQPFAEARPGWKVLRVLGNLFEIEDCDYTHAEQIRDEMRNHFSQATLVGSNKSNMPELTLSTKEAVEINRITEWPIYRVDNIVRHAQSLQASALSEKPAIHLNQNTAKQLHVENQVTARARQNGHVIELTLMIDHRIPDGCVYIPAGFSETAKLGQSFGGIEITSIGAN